MSSAGQKLIAALHDAVAGNFARVTIDGETWVKESDRRARISTLEAENKRLREALEDQQWEVIDRAIDRYNDGEISDLVALGLVAAGILNLDRKRRAALQPNTAEDGAR